MSTRVDPLRSTLDHLALDPHASDDRRYLVSMLRRLGYSDAEIQAHLAGRPGEPGRVIEVEYEGPVDPHVAPAEDAVRPRGGETTFRIASPGDDNLTFTLTDEPTAGVEELSSHDLSGVESDLNDWDDDYAQQDRDEFTSLDETPGEAPDDFGAYGADDDEPVTFDELDEGESLVEFKAAQRPDPAAAAGWIEVPDADPATAAGWREAQEDAWGGEPAEQAWAPAEEETWNEPTWDEQPPTEAEPEPEPLEETPWPEPEPEPEAPVEEAAWPETEPEAPVEEESWADTTPEPEPEPADAWEPEDASWPETPAPEADAPWPEEDTWTPEATPEPEPADAWEDAWEDAAPTAPKAEAAPVQDAWVEDPWPEDAPAQATEAASPATEAAYAHGPYTLYTREVQLSTGRNQRIYFFAKNAPQNGEACALPDGYEVVENDRTGLPFLRRQR